MGQAREPSARGDPLGSSGSGPIRLVLGARKLAGSRERAIPQRDRPCGPFGGWTNSHRTREPNLQNDAPASHRPPDVTLIAERACNDEPPPRSSSGATTNAFRFRAILFGDGSREVGLVESRTDTYSGHQTGFDPLARSDQSEAIRFSVKGVEEDGQNRQALLA